MRLTAERAFARPRRQLPLADRRACVARRRVRSSLRGFVGAPDGSETYRDRISGAPRPTRTVSAATLASRMQAAGAGAAARAPAQRGAAAGHS